MMRFTRSNIIKGLVAILVIVMIFSSISTVFASQRFTDVPEGHWAKEYIEKVHDLGIIKGDEDFATFRPDDMVKELDGIKIISKLLDVDVEFASKAIEMNKDFLDEMNISNDDKKDVAVAIAAGIISKDTLKTILNDKSTEYITKVDVCIFLTRAMGLMDEVRKKEKGLIILPFADVEFIPKNQEAYIEVMMDKGIVSKQGDKDGKFNPESPVSRAVMAKMICEAYDYIEENGVEISFNYDDNQEGNNDEGTNSYSDDKEEESNKTDEKDEDDDKDEEKKEEDVEKEEVKTFTLSGTITGTLKTKNTINIKIKEDNGEEALYQADSKAKAYLDGEEIDILDIKEGAVVEAEVTEYNEILSIRATSFEDQYFGRIVSTANVLVPFMIIEFEKDNRIEESSFYGTDDMIIIRDGKEATFDDLKKGDSVDLKTKDDEIVKIIAQSKNRVFNGVLLKVDFDNTPVIMIQDYNGDIKEYKLSNNTEIVRNSKSVHFIDLKLGDDITVYMEYDKITKVEAEVVKTEASGILSSILIANTSQITVTNDSGKEKTYIISNDADIKVEGKYKTIYDLRLGHKVNMELEGNVIVNLEAERIEQESRYMGELIYINNESNVIMIKADDGQNKLINTTDETIIIDVDGRRKELDSLSVGDELLVVCTHDGVTFIGKNIVIMEKGQE